MGVFRRLVRRQFFARRRFYFGVATGDVNISASTDALTLTEQTASVALDVDISASTDALTLTEQQATITLGVDVAASTDALTLTEQQASIAVDVGISATTDALTLTEFPASIADDVNVSASTDALNLTTFQATVLLGVNISATTDALTLAEQQATITVDVGVQASTDSLTLTEHQATIDDGIVVVSAAGGGRRKRRYIVEVDGQFFEVASIDAAEAILIQVRNLADESAIRDVKTEIAPKPPRVSVKTIAGKVTTSVTLQREVKRTQKVINQAYVRRAKSIAQDIEISKLMIARIKLDDEGDESAIIALLLM